jgi:hypothetical protein
MSLLKLITKLGLATLLFTGLSAHSQETPELSNSETQHSQSCPEEFYSLPVIPEPQFCQQFSANLPASLSYHAKSDQAAAKQFYLDKMGKAESQDKLKGRIVLQYNNGQKVVIISPDGQGSQIDILVKSSS